MRSSLEFAELLFYFGMDTLHEFRYGHGFGFSALSSLYADIDLFFGGFLFSYDEHVGDVLHFVVTNLTADFLVAVVDEHAYVFGFELRLYLVGVFVRLFGNGEDNHLVGGVRQCAR